MFSKELIKSLSWVAEINAIPYLSDISKIKDWITDAFFLSKLPVGSSRNKNLGFVEPYKKLREVILIKIYDILSDISVKKREKNNN